MNFFDIHLPKWPQLMIVGEDVNVEQAKDIIFRTDDALIDPMYHGNSKHFEKWFRKESGIDLLDDLHEKNLGFYTYIEQIEENLKKIDLNFVVSNFAYSAFIGGPHGFCSPEGTIFFRDNIGKWPSVEEVHQDFVKLAKEFPYLKLKASLYDKESCEDNAKVLVSFIVSDGMVILSEDDFGLRDYDFSSKFLEDRMIDRWKNSNELGLPKEWYSERAQQVRVEVDKILKNIESRK